ncbi:MAG TPA: phosphatase PAP2 family protein [Verrucomicrobiae bacterium]
MHLLRAVALCVMGTFLSGCGSIHSPAKSAGFTPADRASTEKTTAADTQPMLTLETQKPKMDSAANPGYTEPLFSKEYGKLLLLDGQHIATAPFHWDGKQWLWAGAAGGGLVAMSLLDKQFASFVGRNHNSTTEKIASNIDPFGAEYSIGVLGAFYVGGAVLQNPKARAVAQDGAAASLIASGIISPSLKLAFGRARPGQGSSAHDFSFFNTHDTAFPSGHTTQAFAVASVIAAHYDSIWIKSAAYGVASLVGYSRIQRNRHWGTDVAAGALIGSLVGNSVVRFNQEHRAEHAQSAFYFIPSFDGEMAGLSVMYRF